ncbi:MAG TPA: acetylxylan esterase [Bacteroidales bacterium]|nr:acetylxylan esterase [Bacteroidales bacterium]
MKKTIIILLSLLISGISLKAQQKFVANYDESKIPPYTLPDPLLFENGTRVQNARNWEKRRTEILTQFQKEVYGESPVWKGKVIPAVMSEDDNALNGTAIRREIRLTLKNGSKELPVALLLYLPKNRKKAPVFLGYNFNGNHTVSDEAGIALPMIWPRVSGPAEKAKESDRGKSYSNWQVKELISNGYGLATAYYCDVDPDFDDGFKNGIHGLFEGQPSASSWGSVAGWAFGLSRIMDYLETVPEVDAKKVIVFGHSRLGKAALWAGATDKRFPLIISNNSGCGGAALSKRIYGETAGSINRAFPHWFCDNFNKYNEKEELLPVDQHELLALLFPRPFYVASAQDDQWADPKGEFLSCVAASPVYVLAGKEGFPASELPPVNTPVMGTIGYHIRTGGHDVTLYDWQQYIKFADMHLGK